MKKTHPTVNLAHVAELTNDNQHTEARQYVAQVLGLSDWVVLFRSIDAIHGIEGSLPEELFRLRNRYTVEMLERVRIAYGAEFAQEINAAL